MRLKRRGFLSAAIALVGELAWMRRASAQTPALRRIGVLRNSPIAGAKDFPAFRDRLRELGHTEGRDILIDARSAEGRPESFPRLAAELVALKPSVMVSAGTEATQAVLRADPVVPIVVLIGDAIETGFAAELKRPGGRVTGVSFLSSSLDPKRLELLATLLPRGSVVLNLSDPNAQTGASRAVADAGRALGLSLHTSEARTLAEIDAALATARRLRAAGINVQSSAFLHANRSRIMEFSQESKIPSAYQWPESAEEGGLIGYGPRLTSLYAQLATFVSRLLGGAKPSELPIEQPTKIELVINMKTARALGISVPSSLLLRADAVIE